MCNTVLALCMYLFAGRYFACVVVVFCGHISLSSHTIESITYMDADFESGLLRLLMSIKKKGVVCAFLGGVGVCLVFREGVLWLKFPLVNYNVVWKVFNLLFENSAETMTPRA